MSHDQGKVEIVVYNRATLLFTTESETLGRIHQVWCRLDDLGSSEAAVVAHPTRRSALTPCP